MQCEGMVVTRVVAGGRRLDVAFDSIGGRKSTKQRTYLE